MLFSYPSCLFLLLCLPVIFWHYWQNRAWKSHFFNLFTLATIGFTIACVLSGRISYYHLYPAIAVSLISLVFIVLTVLHRSNRTTTTLLIIHLLAAFSFSYLYLQSFYTISNGIPAIILLLISVVYGLRTKHFTVMLALLVPLFIGLFVELRLLQVSFYINYTVQNFLIPILISLVFWVILSRYFKVLAQIKLIKVLLVYASMSLIFLQINQAYTFNQQFLNPNSKTVKPYQSLITYIDQHLQKNKRVLFVTFRIDPSVIVYKTHIKLASRFLILGLISELKLIQLDGHLNTARKLKTRFFDMLMSDMQRKPPDYIIVTRRKSNVTFKNHLYPKGQTVSFSYLDFMLSSPRFNQLMRNCQPMPVENQFFYIFHCKYH